MAQNTEHDTISFDEVLSITEELVNNEARVVVDYLYKNPGKSEFDVSDFTGFIVSKVRSLLYELKGKNLVEFERKKDQTKGWYLYYWSVATENYRRVYELEKRKQLEANKELLEEEEETMTYVCPNACCRMTFDEAMDKGFQCGVCSEYLEEEDKEEKVNKLKEKIREQEKFFEKT